MIFGSFRTSPIFVKLALDNEVEIVSFCCSLRRSSRLSVRSITGQRNSLRASQLLTAAVVFLLVNDAFLRDAGGIMMCSDVRIVGRLFTE